MPKTITQVTIVSLVS